MQKVAPIFSLGWGDGFLFVVVVVEELVVVVVGEGVGAKPQFPERLADVRTPNNKTACNSTHKQMDRHTRD